MTNVKQYVKSLEERKYYLENLIEEKQKAMTNAPEGRLRINEDKIRHRTQFYHCVEGRKANGNYIKRENLPLAYQLAQKEYDKDILLLADKELRMVKQYLKSFSPSAITDKYFKYRESRQKLVVPVEESDESFIRRWESVEYTGKERYATKTEYSTEKGEYMRSKSELIIANMLYHKGVPYRYEYPVRLKGLGTIYPDFTVLRVKDKKTIFWEHFGIMDSEEYREKTFEKMNAYILSGFLPGRDFIQTYETYRHPINVKIIEKIIEEMLL